MTKTSWSMSMTSKLGIVGVTLGALAAASAPGFAAQVGTASAVNPSATVNTRTITIGSSIAYAERIRTTAAGSVQVLFIDKTSMTVGPNSDVTIDEYVFDPKAGTGSLVATVGKGALRFVGGLISHNGNAEIKSPTATIGIRGGVAIINGPNVYAGYGTSTVTTAGGTVTLGANEYTQALAGSAPTPPGPPPPGFVASQLALFQSSGGQTGGVAAGTASRANVAAAAARATGSPNVSVVGSLTPPPPASTAATTAQNTARNTNLTQTIQTSAQTAAIQQIVEEQPKVDPRPSVTLVGFNGGLYQDSTGMRPTQSSLGSATVVLDAVGNRVQANFTAFDYSGQSFQYGSVDPADTTPSNYTDYNTFSAQAKRGGTFNGLRYQGEMANVSPAAGRQIAADNGRPDLTVCQCDYTRWGTWTTRSLDSPESIFGFWVAGRPAVATDMPATGSATYVGAVVANVSTPSATSSSQVRLVAGNLTNTVNFAARTGAVSVTGLDNTNYNGTVIIPGNSTAFGGVLAGDVGNRQMGMAGMFYRGLTNPVGEMGGTVAITGTNYVGGGVFSAAVRR